jgi:Flp pilus assembly protein TadG
MLKPADQLRRMRRPDGRAAKTLMRGFVHGESGVAIVETALCITLIMTCMLAIVECCMMGYTYSTYEDAAEQGVRYATMHGTDSSNCSGPSQGCADSTGLNVQNAVSTFASSYVQHVSGMTIGVTYPDSTSTPLSRVMVTVTYTYKPLFGLPGFSHVFTVTSEGRILY